MPFDFITDLFTGTKREESESKATTARTEEGTTTKQLEISQEGIEALIADVLKSEQGLAKIFSEEQVAGVYGSTVAPEAAGDLMAKLAGEIAKLTAKEVVTSTADIQETKTGTATGSTRDPSKGLLGQFGKAAIGSFEF